VNNKKKKTYKHHLYTLDVRQCIFSVAIGPRARSSKLIFRFLRVTTHKKYLTIRNSYTQCRRRPCETCLMYTHRVLLRYRALSRVVSSAVVFRTRFRFTGNNLIIII